MQLFKGKSVVIFSLCIKETSRSSDVQSDDTQWTVTQVPLERILAAWLINSCLKTKDASSSSTDEKLLLFFFNKSQYLFNQTNENTDSGMESNSVVECLFSTLNSFSTHEEIPVNHTLGE